MIPRVKVEMLNLSVEIEAETVGQLCCAFANVIGDLASRAPVVMRQALEGESEKAGHLEGVGDQLSKLRAARGAGGVGRGFFCHGWILRDSKHSNQPTKGNQ